MSRSKRDEMKRSVSQAVNHLAGAVLDVNDVYLQFEGVHPQEAETLKQLMILIAQGREGLLTFAMVAWGLDEEHLISYS